MPDNLTERLAEHVRAHGWDANVAFVADARDWTFAEVFAGAARVAGGYRAAGLRPGDRVLLALPDSMEMVWCLLGAWQAGLVALPVNVQMSRADLERDVQTAEPALAVTDPETAGWLDTAEDIRTTAAATLAEADPEPGFAPGGDASALGLFTSGTTGKPKLCFFRHRDLGGHRGPSEFPGPGTVGFSVSRMYFLGGMASSLFASLDTGQTSVLSRPRATPAVAVELMRRHHVTTFFSQPSFLARLLLEPGHEEVLRPLRQVMCAGEVMSARMRERLVPILGERLINAYGATEIGGIAVGRPADYHPSPSAIGPAFDGRPLRILDEQERELPAGESGHLHIRVPMASRGVARGSLGPDQVHDVWWPTGDLATIDENAVVHVHGRLDDVEVIGGQNVVPGEVELLLESHPRVLEAAVSAVRRPAGFTSLRAYLVATPAEETNPDALTVELLDLARDRLSFYKVPDDVVWLDALPRNGNGKILRRTLRAEGDQFV
ncbi:class I adenylate-forming enzyme family protein [Amycolatopsis jiangsuensis]|uniref:Acyl-coenzyme A synthetase/AMP-(Fatty) acid ligase n=1 Tax=Amycolatopsis jiangsuensis TaxID=1181879 RepID=A0A840J0W4_9PSEU|nr:class I adenylate-forming enzyme family protein [Amycolatopsis jiangsuensis]MBB4686834.1 acyl-coenzyme A synthetase/AMP-(fatty) acid ligase [Amycolatopsis jiangsuensis]